MRIIDGDALVMWLSKWMVSSFGVEPTEETEAIRKVCDAVGDMVKELAKDTGGDLISRQAAIDALRVAYWDDNIQSAKDDPCIVDAMTCWAIRQVKALPSAEPKTGGNTNAIEIYNYLKERIYDTVDDMKEFDAWFERMVWHVKECDRLTARGADMRGEQDAQPNQRWIPCSERLPEDSGYYLVTGDNSTWVSLWKQETWMSATGLPIVLDGITAWMPLPEPWKGEEK